MTKTENVIIATWQKLWWYGSRFWASSTQYNPSVTSFCSSSPKPRVTEVDILQEETTSNDEI